MKTLVNWKSQINNPQKKMPRKKATPVIVETSTATVENVNTPSIEETISKEISKGVSSAIETAGKATKVTKAKTKKATEVIESTEEKQVTDSSDLSDYEHITVLNDVPELGEDEIPEVNKNYTIKLSRIKEVGNIRDTQSNKSFKEINASLKETGQLVPLIVSTNLELVDGYTRKGILESLGVEKAVINVISIETKDIPYYQYVSQANRGSVASSELQNAILSHMILNPEESNPSVAKRFSTVRQIVNPIAAIVQLSKDVAHFCIEKLVSLRAVTKFRQKMATANISDDEVKQAFEDLAEALKIEKENKPEGFKTWTLADILDALGMNREDSEEDGDSESGGSGKVNPTVRMKKFLSEKVDIKTLLEMPNDSTISVDMEIPVELLKEFLKKEIQATKENEKITSSESETQTTETTPDQEPAKVEPSVEPSVQNDDEDVEISESEEFESIEPTDTDDEEIDVDDLLGDNIYDEDSEADDLDGFM